MNTQIIALPAKDNILAILNFNKIANDLKREAIKAMGMAACQARCLSCGHCSAQRCGNR
ncbi:MAG: hypothetical protein MR791_01575 [Bacteroidales bacterium]|nr:hypothetical protein [Bacteroidales bacterium]